MTDQVSLEQLLTPEQYCKWRGISRSAAAQERFRGDGPKFIKAGRSVLYTASGIQEWIDKQTRDRT